MAPSDTPSLQDAPAAPAEAGKDAAPAAALPAAPSAIATQPAAAPPVPAELPVPQRPPSPVERLRDADATEAAAWGRDEERRAMPPRNDDNDADGDARWIDDVPPPPSATEWAAADRDLLNQPEAAQRALLYTTAGRSARLRVALLLEAIAAGHLPWARGVLEHVPKAAMREGRRWIERHDAQLGLSDVSTACVRQFLRQHTDGRWPLVAMRGDDAAEADIGSAQWCTQAQLRRLCDGHKMRDGKDDPRMLRMLRIDVHSGVAGVRTLVPEDATEFRMALVRNAHQQLAHVGKHKMLHHMARTGWHIEGVNELVADVVRLCDVCATSKSHPPAAGAWRRTDDTGKLEALSLVPTAFNDVVHADHIGPFHNGDATKSYILSMTDEFTRWPEAVVVPDVKAGTTADAMLQLWITHYGPPARLVSDRGGAFVNSEVTALAEEFGIQLVHTTAYHPQSNGIEERAHGTLEAMMRAVMLQRGLTPERWATRCPMHCLPCARRSTAARASRQRGWCLATRLRRAPRAWAPPTARRATPTASNCSRACSSAQHSTPRSRRRRLHHRTRMRPTTPPSSGATLCASTKATRRTPSSTPSCSCTAGPSRGAWPSSVRAMRWLSPRRPTRTPPGWSRR